MKFKIGDRIITRSSGRHNGMMATVVESYGSLTYVKYDDGTYGFNDNFLDSNEFYELIKEKPVEPMGLSEWREYGRKHGYDKYYKELGTDEGKLVEEWKAGIFVPKMHEQYARIMELFGGKPQPMEKLAFKCSGMVDDEVVDLFEIFQTRINELIRAHNKHHGKA